MSDLVVLGNPLLDYTVNVEVDILDAFELDKGNVHLVDREDWESLRDEFDRASITAGGSGPNVAASYAMLDGDAALLGAIGRDQAGDIYLDSLDELGVTPHLVRTTTPTGGAITFITPDGDRTFTTYLGAAEEFDRSGIEPSMLDASFLHVEAFQFDTQRTKRAALHAMNQTEARVSLDLSDPRLVREHHDLLCSVIDEHVEIVFGNAREAQPFDDVHSKAPIAAVTHGAKGSTVSHLGERYEIPAFNADLENSNGAGDAYDAGFLYGLSQDRSIEQSALLGSYVAARAVESTGARPAVINKKEFLNHGKLSPQ